MCLSKKEVNTITALSKALDVCLMKPPNLPVNFQEIGRTHKSSPRVLHQQTPGSMKCYSQDLYDSSYTIQDF
jgi:hypothetical protein